jgi:hypothetical protein
MDVEMAAIKAALESAAPDRSKVAALPGSGGTP